MTGPIHTTADERRHTLIGLIRLNGVYMRGNAESLRRCYNQLFALDRTDPRWPATERTLHRERDNAVTSLLREAATIEVRVLSLLDLLDPTRSSRSVTALRDAGLPEDVVQLLEEAKGHLASDRDVYPEPPETRLPPD